MALRTRGKAGDTVINGDASAPFRRRDRFSIKIMVPYGVKGKVKSITEGDFNVTETVCVLETERATIT